MGNLILHTISQTKMDYIGSINISTSVHICLLLNCLCFKWMLFRIRLQRLYIRCQIKMSIEREMEGDVWEAGTICVVLRIKQLSYKKILFLIQNCLFLGNLGMRKKIYLQSLPWQRFYLLNIWSYTAITSDIQAMS